MTPTESAEPSPEDLDPEEITSDVVRFVGPGHDAGECYEIECPRCHDKIQCADGGWWSTKCQCGFTWSVEIRGVGYRYVK